MSLFKSEKFEFPELVTSLLYASAISNVFSICINSPKMTFIIFLNTTIIVLLVFADWYNRILTPMGFPIEDQKTKQQPIIQFSKLFIEIIGMCCLVIFFHYFLKHEVTPKYDELNKYIVFSGYLFMCFIWNYLALGIMQHLRRRDLLWGIILGNVFEIDGLKKYTGRFLDRIKIDENDLKGKLENYSTKCTHNPSKMAINYILHGIKTLLRLLELWLRIKSAKVAAQFIGSHLIWINFVIAFLLTFSFYTGNTNNSLISILFSGSSFYVILTNGMVQLFLIIILFLLSLILTKAKRNLSGILIVFLLLFIYSSFDADILIYMMIGQQILVGVIIQYVTKNHHDENKSIEEAAKVFNTNLTVL